MSYITAIGTANPPNRFTQSSIASFMAKTMTLKNGDERKLKTVFRASGIEYRHSVLEDYGKTENFSFYPESNQVPYPTTQDRLKIFRSGALKLSVDAVHDMLATRKDDVKDSITHLIIVCCTGMYAPGLDIELVQKLGLHSTVQRTAITFMGCYAAFNALKVADAICKSDAEAKVLIVCTELCSIHFQRQATDDNLLANALFADGAAAVLVENEATEKLNFKLCNFHSDLAPEGSEDMAWSIGDLGFEMKLSAYVPDIIRKGIAHLTADLLKKIGATINDIKHFAIHPGGRKILEVIERELGIKSSDNYAAYHVLKNFGNMSSPTILFVLNEIRRNLTAANRGEKILSFAFGPGLTMESMILQIE
jgi:predicted naringenin-chalcone synthase